MKQQKICWFRFLMTFLAFLLLKFWWWRDCCCSCCCCCCCRCCVRILGSDFNLLKFLQILLFLLLLENQSTITFMSNPLYCILRTEWHYCLKPYTLSTIFTNILRVDCLSTDTKSLIRHWRLNCLFVLLGSAR